MSYPNVNANAANQTCYLHYLTPTDSHYYGNFRQHQATRESFLTETPSPQPHD